MRPGGKNTLADGAFRQPWVLEARWAKRVQQQGDGGIASSLGSRLSQMPIDQHHGRIEIILAGPPDIRRWRWHRMRKFSVEHGFLPDIALSVGRRGERVKSLSKPLDLGKGMGQPSPFKSGAGRLDRVHVGFGNESEIPEIVRKRAPLFYGEHLGKAHSVLHSDLIAEGDQDKQQIDGISMTRNQIFERVLALPLEPLDALHARVIMTTGLGSVIPGFEYAQPELKRALCFMTPGGHIRASLRVSAIVAQ